MSGMIKTMYLNLKSDGFDPFAFVGNNRFRFALFDHMCLCVYAFKLCYFFACVCVFVCFVCVCVFGAWFCLCLLSVVSVVPLLFPQFFKYTLPCCTVGLPGG